MQKIKVVTEQNYELETSIYCTLGVGSHIVVRAKVISGSHVFTQDLTSGVDRVNCFCASLLRTQIHATSSMSTRA